MSGDFGHGLFGHTPFGHSALISEVDNMAILTVSSLEGRILNRINNKLDTLLVREIIEAQYRELFSQWTWSFGRTTGGFNTLAPLSGGTVAVTNGTTAVIGTGTAFTTAYENGFISIGGNVYNIGSITNTLRLDLGTGGYAGSTDTGLSYSLFQPRYTLPAGVSHLTSIAAGQYSLIEVPLSYIIDRDPWRQSSGNPLFFSYCGYNSSGLRLIELYPYPSTSLRVNFEGLKLGSFSLATSTTIIEDQIIKVIIDGSLAECCREIAMRDDKPEVFLTLSNTYEEKFTKGLEGIMFKDLSSFGTPNRQGYGRSGSINFSDGFLSNHDVGDIS